MLGRADTTIAALCEPSESALAAAAAEFTAREADVPPSEPDWQRFVERYAPTLDAVVIITPHVFHAAQATACLEAGLDVLLEKPMVMDAAEAAALIATRDRTGRLLVVAFPGSLSPQVRTAARLIASGEVGGIHNVDALVWQDWRDQHGRDLAAGSGDVGRRLPVRHGGHMLNTVADLAGEDITELAAWLETTATGRHARRRHGPPRIGRARDHERLRARDPVARVGRSACSASAPTIRTGVWGERLEIQRVGSKRLTSVRSVASRTVWEQFLAVRAGREPNPSPPEVGLRMARLWDAIRESSARGGAVVASAESRRMTVRVTVWNEFRQERSDEAVRAIYPDGIHARDRGRSARATTASRSGRRPSTNRTRA